jgi:hypothetical protein
MWFSYWLIEEVLSLEVGRVERVRDGSSNTATGGRVHVSHLVGGPALNFPTERNMKCRTS